MGAQIRNAREGHIPSGTLSAPSAGESTDAVHAAERRLKPEHALVEPIFHTSTYTFDNMADVCLYQEAHNDGHADGRFEYGRYGNPSVAAAEARLAALEKAQSAVQVASGMAALSYTLLHFLSSGDHIILTDDSYRRTRQFCQEHLRRFNITCTVVPFGDFDALEDAIRPETRILFSETPTNPYLRVLDVERFAEIGRRHGALTVVDATFATPINLRPLEWGVDLVVHSATKYLGGHNDLLAGFIAGRSELISPLRDSIGILGGISDPHTAYLLLRGMKTLSLRVERHNLNGQRAAEFLVGHPAVDRVWYPGLPSHPGHEIAVRQMPRGFGGVLSFTVRSDQPATFRFMDALQLIYISPSLGGTESLALHPAAMAYSDCSPAERLQLGIPDNLIRLALGIEDADDLIADLEQALSAV
jgi:cystathionine gamma-synthase